MKTYLEEIYDDKSKQKFEKLIAMARTVKREDNEAPVHLEIFHLSGWDFQRLMNLLENGEVDTVLNEQFDQTKELIKAFGRDVEDEIARQNGFGLDYDHMIESEYDRLFFAKKEENDKELKLFWVLFVAYFGLIVGVIALLCTSVAAHIFADAYIEVSKHSKINEIANVQEEELNHN